MESSEKTPDSKEKKPNKVAAYFMLIEVGTTFAFMLALPLIAFIYLGRWADAKYGTKYFVVVGILLAITLSSFMIYRKIKEIVKNLK